MQSTCDCHVAQHEVLEECKMMVPHTQQRLEAAHAELAALLVRACHVHVTWY